MSGTELVTDADAADPLRIVLVAPPYFDIPPKGYGGVEVVVAELADALVKRGHDVTVLGAGELVRSTTICTRITAYWATRSA